MIEIAAILNCKDAYQRYAVSKNAKEPESAVRGEPIVEQRSAPAGDASISTKIGFLPSFKAEPIRKRKDQVRDRTYGFEIPPDLIPSGDIREHREAEVVVIGAGIAGLSAAISAAEAGANTILLE